MPNKLKAGEKDKKLLMMLSSVLIIAVSFMFIFQPCIKKKKEIDKKNASLAIELADLRTKEAQRSEKEAEIKKIEKQTADLLNKYSPGFSKEKDIMFVAGLEESADMKVEQINFGSTQLYYLNAGSNAAATDGAKTDGAQATPAQPADTQATPAQPADGQAATGQLSEGMVMDDLAMTNLKSQMKSGSITYAGLKTQITLSYKTTYKGLKKSIDYINNYQEKMSLESVTSNFDSSTGGVSGQMVINEYAVLGTGNEYQDPNISNVKVGKKDLFNTVKKKRLKK